MSWMLLKIEPIKDVAVKQRFVGAIKNLSMIKSYHCPYCYYDITMMSTDVICNGCLEEGKLLNEINDYMDGESKAVG